MRGEPQQFVRVNLVPTHRGQGRERSKFGTPLNLGVIGTPGTSEERSRLVSGLRVPESSRQPLLSFSSSRPSTP
jgi:hypothetical protein